jgi:hypothetical protein
MNHHEALDYELHSSPITSWVGLCILPKWITTALGNYFAWKVNRKMARYLKFKKP